MNTFEMFLSIYNIDRDALSDKEIALIESFIRINGDDWIKKYAEAKRFLQQAHIMPEPGTIGDRDIDDTAPRPISAVTPAEMAAGETGLVRDANGVVQKTPSSDGPAIDD